MCCENQRAPGTLHPCHPPPSPSFLPLHSLCPLCRRWWTCRGGSSGGARWRRPSLMRAGLRRASWRRGPKKCGGSARRACPRVLICRQPSFPAALLCVAPCTPVSKEHGRGRLGGTALTGRRKLSWRRPALNPSAPRQPPALARSVPCPRLASPPQPAPKPKGSEPLWRSCSPLWPPPAPLALLQLFSLAQGLALAHEGGAAAQGRTPAPAATPAPLAPAAMSGSGRPMIGGIEAGAGGGGGSGTARGYDAAARHAAPHPSGPDLPHVYHHSALPGTPQILSPPSLVSETTEGPGVSARVRGRVLSAG